ALQTDLSVSNQEPAMQWIGIDVSKSHLDVYARPRGASGRFDNDEAGRKALYKWLLGQGPCQVVMEPTGGYERALMRQLLESKIPVCVVNARQIRDFARATGRLSKTDRIDAEVIAHFGEAIKPQPREGQDAQGELIEALLVRRRQLVDMRVMESNRRALVTSRIRARIDQGIELLSIELCPLY